MSELAARHDDLRPLMFSVAYRMLGSVTEAEDVVQEAFLKMHRAGGADDLRSLDAYAVTVTTRLAIDALRSARRQRERYVGTWLPEPLVDSPDTDPSHRIEADETLSVAFLAVLERLSPTERAVFLLREVFAYSYEEIAAVVDRTPQNCRQLLRRARTALESGRPRFDPSAEDRAALAAAFFDALRVGEVERLESLLADQVVFAADGGGKTAALVTPARGRTRVARFLSGLSRQGARFGAQVDPVEANGQPAARILDAEGALLAVMALEIADGRIRSVSQQMNPDKLQHLGTVGDLNALVPARRVPSD